MDADEGTPVEKVREDGGCVGLVRRRLPVLTWAARYERGAAVADLVAGITLGLTLVPQSIAYAALADLPVQYGLYSAFLGTMLYAGLGTVKEVSIGPTSLMALLTLQTCRGLPVDFVVLLTFLSGCVVLLMGILRMGFLVDLISPSVTSGFTSATAVIVLVAQVKGLLGLSFTAESVVENVTLISENLHSVRWRDCALSVVCCSVLLALRKLKDLPLSPKRRKLKKILWFVSISRNALVVCAASAVAYLTYVPDEPLFKLSGRVEQGVPRLSLPPFSTTMDNRTVSFTEMVSQLGSGVVVLPLVMVLANIAIAKAFTVGARVDATQEMLALGLCNVAGSLVHAMPTCGAFTRSAVGHSSGVRTPAASLYAGLITLLALNFLTQYFFFIPKACLSSVLVCAVMFMIDISIVLRLWRTVGGRGEAAVVVGTFAVGLWRSVELAVMLGALAALALALRPLLAARAIVHSVKVRCSSGCESVYRVRPPRALLYLNAERLEARVLLLAGAAPRTPVLIDCAPIAYIDYNAAQVLSRLIKKFKAKEQMLVFYNASGDILSRLEAADGMDPRALHAGCAQEALDAVSADAAHTETTPLLQVVNDQIKLTCLASTKNVITNDGKLQNKYDNGQT